MKKKSIIIKENDHKVLVQLSKQFGVNYGILIGQILYYFKKTGINPSDSLNENPSTLVKTLDKRIVSFLKVQERDILKPIRTENYQYYQEHKKYIMSLSKWVENALIKINENDSIRTKKVEKEFENQKKKLHNIELALLEISKLIDEKNKSGIQSKLKTLFK